MIGQRKVFDCFPFFGAGYELDILELRLNELSAIVDRWIITEAEETYGGDPKPLNLKANWRRFERFWDRIEYIPLRKLEPKCTDRKTGREREAYQRDMILPALRNAQIDSNDLVIFSDCDEIPDPYAVSANVAAVAANGVYRLKQYQFYYNVNTVTDYGHDWGSRARIGLFRDVLNAGSMYEFRMTRKDTNAWVIEYGGWHFSYFGGVENIKTKVASLSPFLNEYKLFGDKTLEQDIAQGRDLHHRKCELPDIFALVPTDSICLPEYLIANKEKFKHFFADRTFGR